MPPDIFSREHRDQDLLLRLIDQLAEELNAPSLHPSRPPRVLREAGVASQFYRSAGDPLPSLPVSTGDETIAVLFLTDGVLKALVEKQEVVVV